MKKTDIGKYVSGELKISHVSFRGTGWKSKVKFPVISAEYNKEFGVFHVKFVTRSYGIMEEFVSSSNVSFYEIPEAPSVQAGTFEKLTFYYLLTDCNGQYGAGVGSRDFTSKAEADAFAEKVGHRISYDYSDAARRDSYHSDN